MSALPHSLPDSFEQVAPLPVGGAVPTSPSVRLPWHRLCPPEIRLGVRQGMRQGLSVLWRGLSQQGNGLGLLQGRPRRMRVRETVSLGEKRFVSLLEVDGQSFLLGGSGTGIALLATLAPAPEAVPFERVLRDSLDQGGAR